MCLGVIVDVPDRAADVVAPPSEGGGPRRRPRAGRMPIRATPALVVGLVALGVFLPLFGISLLVVLLLDQLVLRRVPALSRWFDVTPAKG